MSSLLPAPRRLGLVLAAGLAVGACAEGAKPSGSGDGAAGAADGPRADAGDTADLKSDSTAEGKGDARDGGYASDGACTPGVPSCNGDFGYRMCEPDGGWGEAHSCAGYSSNGTTSYCADLPTDDGAPWGTCIDPACWYWWKRGLLDMVNGGVGVCLPDGTFNRCNKGGTLSIAPCRGTCTRVATLDGRAVGFCSLVCDDGARECLGGSFYRTCTLGRWDTAVKTCVGGCNPVGANAVPDVRCGGPCEAGTSRCSGDLGAVELCGTDGTWKLDRACALGRCRPAGAQAECEAECLAGQHTCAFDGAGEERRCDDAGRWTAELPCGAGTSCRVSGSVALGCVACVGPHLGAGNAYGSGDSRCVPVTPDGGANVAVEQCGADDTWHTQIACASNERCAAISRGPSSLAACELAP